eukprot:scaffold42344_cov65-Attheya_sp.AAC.1
MNVNLHIEKQPGLIKSCNVARREIGREDGKARKKEQNSDFNELARRENGRENGKARKTEGQKDQNLVNKNRFQGHGRERRAAW